MSCEGAKDDRGRIFAVGDQVVLLYIDRDRGAEMWMHKGKVVGFGRTRLKVQFPSRSDVSAVGPECLRVVVPEGVASCDECGSSEPHDHPQDPTDVWYPLLDGTRG